MTRAQLIHATMRALSMQVDRRSYDRDAWTCNPAYLVQTSGDWLGDLKEGPDDRHFVKLHDGKAIAVFAVDSFGEGRWTGPVVISTRRIWEAHSVSGTFYNDVIGMEQKEGYGGYTTVHYKGFLWYVAYGYHFNRLNNPGYTYTAPPGMVRWTVSYDSVEDFAMAVLDAANVTPAWTCDPAYLVDAAGTDLGTSNDRHFYKQNDGLAIAVYEADVSNEFGAHWYGPALISTIPEAVTTNYPPYSGTIDYGGLTWYYNTGYHYQNATYSTGVLTPWGPYSGSKQDELLSILQAARVRIGKGGFALWP